MQNDAPVLGYHNYDLEREPLAHKLRLPLLILAGLLVIIGLVFLFTRERGQSLDEIEEPSVEYAGANSPLANIQLLTSNGLTFEQYKNVYDDLTAYFRSHHPDYLFVRYVEDSLKHVRESDCEPSDMLDEEEEIDRCERDEFAPLVLTFKLISDTNDEYSVEVELDDSRNSATTKLHSSTDEQLL